MEHLAEQKRKTAGGAATDAGASRRVGAETISSLLLSPALLLFTQVLTELTCDSLTKWCLIAQV